jgi:flagellar basal body rod protein FlgG
MNTFKKTTALVALALILLGAFAIAQPAPAAASHVTPTVISGNPSCTDLGYDFGYKPQPEPPPSGTYSFPGDPINTVTINSDGTYFDWSSTLGIDAVIVKGGSNANVYAYDPPAESFGDTGLHSPINPNNGSPYAISHIEFCYDYEVDVSKTAETTFTRTYEWDITKDFDGEYWMFAGDSTTHGYKVSVTKTGYTDSDWAVNGTITIENNTPFDATITGVSDAISGFGAVAVDCGVTFPHILAAGGTLECSYSTPLPDGSSRTNTATVTTTGTVGGDEATADVIFGDPTTEVNKEINVSDTNGMSWGPVSNDTSWTYNKTFTCSDNPADYTSGYYMFTKDNTATIDETGQSDDASITVHCYAPVVSKDAETSFTRTYEWDITKDPDGEYWMFAGDSTTQGYDIEVTKTGYTDSDWAVAGTITVQNPNPKAAMTVSLADVVSPDIAATLDCGGSLVVPAGGSATCDYGADLPDGSDRTNTATATLNGIDFSGSADVIFGDPTTEVNEEINVSDDFGTADDDSDDKHFGPFSDSATESYDRTFECSSDPADYTNGYYTYNVTNVAEIDETGQNDDASVTVHCYAPVVSKDAETSFTRTWNWTIDKSADQTELLLSSGQLFQVNYEVMVDATYTDSDWAVAGTITVQNPNPEAAMTVSLADVVSPDIAATLDCGGSLMVPAGGSATCDYGADLPDGSDRTNTATATLNGIDFSGSADVIFGDPTEEIDECIDVSDTNVGILGTVCADQAPATFSYSLWFGQHPDADVYLECGDNTHTNVASFLANDTGATGDDSWTVNANVACDFGCSLTPGYWKTHSEYGPAPYDDTWAILPDAADTPFFLSGQSYYEVLWTAPQGNAYYILAHAYIAAELNFLNGADPSAAQAAFDEATVLFNTYTPDEVAALKGKTGKDLRAKFIDLAEILDDYNNGLIGPGHCSE